MTVWFSTVMTRAHSAALVLALLPLTANAEPATLKFAFFASDREFAYGGVVKPFVDAVNAEGKGTVQIEILAGGMLGRSYARQADLVRSGAADFAWVHPALTPEKFPENGVLELPGVFRDADEITQVYTRLTAAKSLKGYDDFFVVAAMGTHPLTIHTRKPVTSLDDLRTMKVRTSNPTEGAVLRALGMDPKFIPINEAADSINSGAIDGATAALEVLMDFGISRFASHHYMLGLGSVPLLIVMNNAKFNSLPADAQNVIRKYSGAWTARRYVDSINAYNRQIEQKLQLEPRRNVVYPAPRDRVAARKTFDSTIESWANSSPRNRELLSIVELEIAKQRSARE